MNLKNPLEILSRFSASYPYRVLVSAIVLSILAVNHTIGHLEFKSSRNDLISLTEPAVQRYKHISENFGRMTHATVVVEGNDLARMKQFIIDLADQLKKEPEFFENPFYKIDTSSLEGKKLLYLSQNELRDLENKLRDYGELIEDLTFEPRMSLILAFINQKISEATVSHLISELIGADDSSEKETTPSGASFGRRYLL